MIDTHSLVQYLVEKGANIEAPDFSQRTPLHFACQYGHLPVVQYLIEKRANIKAKIWKDPLHIACKECHLPVVQLLLEKGANIETKAESSQCWLASCFPLFLQETTKTLRNL